MSLLATLPPERPDLTPHGADIEPQTQRKRKETMKHANGLMIGDKIDTTPVVTVFSGFHYSDGDGTWLQITDERSGEVWDEPINGWTYYLNNGGYYQHRDGRIVSG